MLAPAVSRAAVLLAVAAVAAAQAVTQSIAPSAAPPPGCAASHQGLFGISAVALAGSKRAVEERDACASNALTMSLSNGILTDPRGRTGYIAANFQFQFDGPPQAGAIYTAGFSLCGNGSLALGGSAVFWQCLSGSFYNLYDRDWAAQCAPVTFDTYDCTGGGPVGQPSAIATSAVAVAVTATETNAAGSLAASVGLSTLTTAASAVPSSGAAIIVASNGQPGYNSTARPTPATTTAATNGTTAAIATTAASGSTGSGSTGTSTKPAATSSSSAAAAHPLFFDREVAALVAGAVLAVL